jgi:hypothetical protein
MAHDVSFSIPDHPVGRADVKFVVKRDGGVLGTLEVSKGSVVWFPRGHSYGYKWRWTDLAEVMRDEAHRSEKR